MTIVYTTARAQFYADIIICAVEGGTNYWAFSHDYQHETPETTSVQLASQDEVVGLGTSEDGIWHTVTLDTIAEGFKKIRGQEGLKINERLRKEILTAYDEMEAGDIDATAADVLVQVALFGEVMYSQ